MIKSIVVISLFWASIASAGQEVGNGGDGVFCRPDARNAFSGFYSLDYLLTFRSANQNADNGQITSTAQSLERIRTLIDKNIPEFAESFHEFTRMIGNQDYSLRRVWEEAPFGLVDIKDEKMIALVPSNCRDNDTIQIQQAIVRQLPIFSGDEMRKELIFYRFVPSLLRDLEKTSPLQLSFLYVHEWLWDLSHDVDLNRRINRFLHSAEIEKMDRRAVRNRLISLGLKIPKEISSQEFYFDSCPADPAAAKKLIDQLKAETILAKQGAVYARVTECQSQIEYGCIVGDQRIYGSSLTDVSVTWYPANPSEKFIFRGTQPAVFSFGCDLDIDTAEFNCSQLYSSSSSFPNFGGSSDAPGVSGRLGHNGCVRMYQRKNSGLKRPDGQILSREDKEFLFSTNID